MKKIISIGVSLFLVGCAITTTTPRISADIKDGGFLSKEPCGPPCFFNITPGGTTEAEVQEVVISQKNVFQDCNLIDDTSKGGGRGLYCDYDIGIGYDGHVVDGVSFSPATNITLQQVIDQYGPPDLVIATVISLPDHPFKSHTVLYYDHFHGMLGIGDQSGTEFNIDPGTTITIISYTSEKRYQQIMSVIKSSGVSWQGYGIYQAVLP
jgi:hypothetical protein